MADNPDSSELQGKERPMEPGDALYLPKGVVHAAQTDEAAPAAHLTISVPMRGRTWGDLLTYVSHAAADESSAAAGQRCALKDTVRRAINEASHIAQGLGLRRSWSKKPTVSPSRAAPVGPVPDTLEGPEPHQTHC